VDFVDELAEFVRKKSPNEFRLKRSKAAKVGEADTAWPGKL